MFRTGMLKKVIVRFIFYGTLQTVGQDQTFRPPTLLHDSESVQQLPPPRTLKVDALLAIQVDVRRIVLQSCRVHRPTASQASFQTSSPLGEASYSYKSR